MSSATSAAKRSASTSPSPRRSSYPRPRVTISAPSPLAASALRTCETYSCTILAAVGGGSSPQSASTSRSLDTVEPSSRASTASSARGLPLPMATERPSAVTSTGPRTLICMCLPRPRRSPATVLALRSPHKQRFTGPLPPPYCARAAFSSHHVSPSRGGHHEVPPPQRPQARHRARRHRGPRPGERRVGAPGPRLLASANQGGYLRPIPSLSAKQYADAYDAALNSGVKQYADPREGRRHAGRLPRRRPRARRRARFGHEGRRHPGRLPRRQPRARHRAADHPGRPARAHHRARRQRGAADRALRRRAAHRAHGRRVRPRPRARWSAATPSGARTDLLKGPEVGRVDAARLLGQCARAARRGPRSRRMSGRSAGRCAPSRLSQIGAQAAAASAPSTSLAQAVADHHRVAGPRAERLEGVGVDGRVGLGRCDSSPETTTTSKRSARPEASNFSRCRHEAPLVTSASA